MGITLLDVNLQTARPPEEVKAAFDDAIAARENEQQYIREAEAYANEVQPQANGQAQRLLEEGRAYKARTILESQGEVQCFAKVLPEYKAAPEITRQRLYIDSMERVLSNTRKFFFNNKLSNNVIVLPMEQMLTKQQNNNNSIPHSKTDTLRLLNNLPTSGRNSSKIGSTVMDQRHANTHRNDETIFRRNNTNA